MGRVTTPGMAGRLGVTYPPPTPATACYCLLLPATAWSVGRHGRRIDIGPTYPPTPTWTYPPPKPATAWSALWAATACYFLVCQVGC